MRKLVLPAALLLAGVGGLVAQDLVDQPAAESPCCGGASTTALVCPVYSFASHGDYWSTYAVQCPSGPAFNMDTTQQYYPPDGTRCMNDPNHDCIQAFTKKGKGNASGATIHQKGLENGLTHKRAPKKNPVPPARRRAATLISGPVLVRIVTNPNDSTNGRPVVALYQVLIDPSKLDTPLMLPKTVLGTGLEIDPRAAHDEDITDIAHNPNLERQGHVARVVLGNVQYQVVFHQNTTFQ